MFKYDCSQAFDIQAAMEEANDRAEQGWKLHTIFMKAKSGNTVYTLIFEKKTNAQS